MKGAYRSNFFALILVLLQIFGSLLLKPIFVSLHLSLGSVLVLAEVLFLIVPVAIYFIITRESVIETLRIKPLKLPSILIIILIGVLIQPLAMFLGSLTSIFFHNNVNDVFYELGSMPFITLLGVIALTPAICEEAAMRGVVLSGYKEMGIKKAAIMSGFLFAILHLNPPQFLYTFVLGALFAYLVHITDSIFSSMICHFTFNGLQAALAWLSIKFLQGPGSRAQDMSSLPIAAIIIVLGFLLMLSAAFTFAVYVLVRVLKDMNSKKEETMENRRDAFEEPHTESDKIKERILNWPLFAVIAVYIIFVFVVHVIK